MDARWMAGQSISIMTPGWRHLKKNGIDGTFYANRTRSYDEIMPWDHLDYGVTKQFLIRENQKAHEAMPTPNCREKCSGCGASCLIGRSCF